MQKLLDANLGVLRHIVERLQVLNDRFACSRSVARISPAGAHGSWRRQAILAVVRSEAVLELLAKSGAVLLADEGALLVELCTTIVSVETVATADIVAMPNGAKLDLPRSYRTDVTGSSIFVLRWALGHVAEIPMAAIGAVVDVVEIQILLLRHLPVLARRSASMLFDWLLQLDIRDAEVTIPGDLGAGRLASDARRRMVEKLRTIALLLGEFAPVGLKAYLTAIELERDHYKIKDLRRFASVIAPVAPAELASMIRTSLIEKRDRRRRAGSSLDRVFGFADSDYLPPSPAQPPFLELLNAAPSEGLSLIRALVDKAIAYHANGRDPGDDGFTIDLGGRPRFFPWTNSYGWSRGGSHEYSVVSALRALEAWSQKRLDDGDHVAAVLADILGPDGSSAAYVLIAVDVLLSHGEVAREPLAPFLASPALLAIDRHRQINDQVGAGIEGIGVRDEPKGLVMNADLRGRPSRGFSLIDTLPGYLPDEPVGNGLRAALSAAVATLDPYESHSTSSDPRFAGRQARNLLESSNWVATGEGKLAYKSPPDEAAHFAAMEVRRGISVRASETEARITMAVDGGNYATAETAQLAVDYAEGGLPDDGDSDHLKSRSTRLITTALLVARDGDDSFLAAHEDWVRQVIALAFEEVSDRGGGSQDTLRFNRPAIATLALIHLWARKGGKADRDAIVRLATRKDRSAAPAVAAGFTRILEFEPRLFKAAMRAAFASMVWRWDSHDPHDVAPQEAFDVAQAASIEAAVLAELAWLDGGTEPDWPAWPEERPHLRRGSTMWVPGPVTSEEFDADDALETAIAQPPSVIHVDSQAAANWLAMLQSAPKGAIAWRQDVVTAYAGWTARMNGLGLSVDAELNREPDQWNLHYYALFAERLLDGSDTSFAADMAFVTGLPDAPFGDVAQTVQHTVDALYFNEPTRSPERPLAVRAGLIARVMALRRWRSADDPASPRIDMESGGVVAKMLFNTHDPFSGTRSYVPVALFDRLDPLLAAMRPMLPGGPTTFVALCTTNLLLVAPRARHLEFLLEASEAWFGRTQGAGLWIGASIGGNIVKWFEAAIAEEPGLLMPTHPARDRIDGLLGRLVGVGVAEAHDIELRVEAAAIQAQPQSISARLLN